MINSVVNNHAHNGVRIVLNSKLVLLCALAILCLAIVCLGVLYNFDALATGNIAYASLSDGIVNGNLFPVNYFIDKNYIASSYSYLESLSFKDDYNASKYCNLYISNGSVSTVPINNVNYMFITCNGGYIKGSLSLGISNSSNSTTFVNYSVPITYTVYVSSVNDITVKCGGLSSSTLVNGKNTFTSSSGSASIVFSSSLTSGSSSFILHWIKVEYGSDFTGFVKTDYFNYGYNQGVNSVDTQSYYDNGYNAGYIEGHDFGYNEGYEDGLDSDAYQEGYDVGYQEGHDAGYQEGYDFGYSEGASSLLAGYSVIDSNFASGFNSEAYVYDGIKYDSTIFTNRNDSSDVLPYSCSFSNDPNNPSGNIRAGFQFVNSLVGNMAFQVNLFIDENDITFNDYVTRFKVLIVNLDNNNASLVNLFDYGTILNIGYSRQHYYYSVLFKYNPTDSSNYTYYLVYDHTISSVTSGFTQYISSFDLTNFILYSYTGIVPTEEYTSGFTDGYTAGYSEGASNENAYYDGFNNGYSDGLRNLEEQKEDSYNLGHSIGYNEGLATGSSNQYSFMGLMGAVMDAPVSALNGLLDFDILGVNIKTFLVSIMAFAVALFVLKIVFSR